MTFFFKKQWQNSFHCPAIEPIQQTAFFFSLNNSGNCSSHFCRQVFFDYFLRNIHWKTLHGLPYNEWFTPWWKMHFEWKHAQISHILQIKHCSSMVLLVLDIVALSATVTQAHSVWQLWISVVQSCEKTVRSAAVFSLRFIVFKSYSRQTTTFPVNISPCSRGQSPKRQHLDTHTQVHTLPPKTPQLAFCTFWSSSHQHLMSQTPHFRLISWLH